MTNIVTDQIRLNIQYLQSRRLPQLNFITIGINEPAEFAIVVGNWFTHYLAVTRLNLNQRLIQVINDKVEHKAVVGGLKIFNRKSVV